MEKSDFFMFKRKAVRCFFYGILFPLVISCDIGLGASVDTQTPKLDFESPSSSADVVYSGEIPVYGNISDDKGVTRVDVVVLNTGTNEVVGETLHAAIIDGTKWELTLQAGRSANSDSALVLPDGSYELSATAYDAAGHSYKRERTFKVDSTSPVFVVSKPGTLNIGSPDPYGRTVQITGKISDDNNVKTMKVRVFREDGTEIELAKNEFTGFDTADTAVNIAKYYENEDAAKAKGDEDIYENYKRIYGVKGDAAFDTEQKYYAVVSVIDAAGNESKMSYVESYLKEELSLLGESLEMYEIKNLLNGSYTGSLTEQKKEIVLDILNAEGDYALPNRYFANDTYRLAFSVDSRANPTYALDYSYLPGDSDSFTEILKDQALNIEVSAGLDKAYIKPDSLCVKIYEILPTGTINEDAEPVVTIESQNIYIGSSDNHITEDTPMTTSAKYRVKISEFSDVLLAGKSYAVKIDGYDQDNNEFIAADGKNYGFKIQTTASAPTVNFNIKNAEYRKASDFDGGANSNVVFTVKDETGSAMKFTVMQKIFDGIKEESEIAFEEGTYTFLKNGEELPASSGEHVIEIPLEIPADKLSLEKNYTIALRVSADKVDNATSRTYYFYADNAAPKIELSNSELVGWDGLSTLRITEETASITKDSSGTYSYKIQGSWSDEEGSGTKTVHYAVKAATMTEYSPWYELERQEAPQVKDSAYWTKSFPVVHGEGKDICIKYYAEDQVGNCSDIVEFTGVTFDFGKPEISLAENTSALSSYYKKDSVAKLSLTASDTNELNSVVTKIYTKQSSEDKNPVLIDVSDYDDHGITFESRVESTKETSVNISFSTDGKSTLSVPHDGIYMITVVASDIAGRESVVYQTETVIDGTVPVLDSDISVGSSLWNGNKFYNDTRLNISGQYNDDRLDTVYYYVKKSGVSETVPSDLSVRHTGETSSFESGVFKFNSVEFSENKVVGSLSTANVIYIQAKDKAGNLSQISEYKINVDTSAPDISGLYYQVGSSQIFEAGGTVYVNGTKPVTVYGLYSDEHSGVDGLELNVNGEEMWYSQEVLTDSSSVEAVEWKSYADITNKQLIRSWKAKFTPTEGASLHVEGKNLAGTSRSLTLFPLALDDAYPSINSFELYEKKQNSESAAYTDNETEKSRYFANPASKTFILRGTVTDNYGLDSVKLVITSESNKVERLQNFTTASGSYEFAGIDMSSWTKTASAVIAVTDKSGNVTEKNFEIIFDTSAPTGYHEVDSTFKDLYFRFGKADNDDINTGNSLWNASLDKDVGSKYAEGTYGNATQSELRGNISDGINGSGVKRIYYAVFDKPVETSGSSVEPVLSDGKYIIKDLDSLRDYVISNSTGFFAPSAEEKRRVFYSMREGEEPFEDSVKFTDSADDNGMLRYYKTVATNYRSIFSGFDGTVNYLVIAAVDNAGNAGIDYAIVDGEQKIYLTINRDPEPADITLDESSSGIKYVSVKQDGNGYSYKNGQKFILSGTASDNAAGVKSIAVRVGKTNLITETDSTYGNLTVTRNGLTAEWTVEIKAEAFKDSSGNEVIFGIVTDMAGDGNTNELPLTTVIADTKAPVVSLNSPEDADSSVQGIQVNRLISFAGTVSDDNTLPSAAVTRLEYSVKTNGWQEASASWTPVVPSENPGENDFQISGSYSFTVKNFNTADLTDGTTYMLRAVASDIAGNEGRSSCVEVQVSQDTDRPVVTLTNLKIDEDGITYLKSTTTLYGTVSDDDGSIKSFKYSLNRGTSWSDEIVLSGSSWSISGFTEGRNSLWFKVTDSAGTEFVSGSAAKPKICDSGTGSDKHYVTSQNAELAFNVVTERPTVNNIKYYVFDSEENSWSSEAASLGTLGGAYSKFKVSISAKSAQYVGGAKVVYGGTEYSFTCDDADYDDTEVHVWRSEEIALASSSSFLLVVYDQVPDPMLYEQTVNFSIDNVSPEVKISKTAATVGVSETMRGEVVNENEFKVYYAVSRTEADVPQDEKVIESGTVRSTPWTEIVESGNGTSWFVYFDDELDAADHTDKFAVYLTEKYLGITTAAAIEAPLNPYDEITPVYFWVKAVDGCKNHTEMCQLVNVDPQGERPSVEVSYPVDIDSKAPTLGGAIRMTGTAVDNNAAKYVWVQIAEGVSADFTLADLTKLFNLKDSGGKRIYTIGNMTTNTAVNSLAGITEQSASNYGIMVEVKGTGWNQTINTNKEFNPSSDGKAELTLIFYATDEEMHRSIPIVQNIEIDAKSPYVDANTLYLVQYNSSGTVIARQPYSDGKNVKGIWYLTGTFKDDDSGISKVVYNDAEKISSAGASFTDGKDSNIWFKPVADSYNGNVIYNYEFSVPMGSEEAGKVGSSSVEFYVEENTDTRLSLPLTYTITFDNKAPVFNTEASNTFVKLDDKIQNQSGFYTFGAIASEDKIESSGVEVEQSGVKHIAFYFTRDLGYSLGDFDAETYPLHVNELNSKTNDLFDVMIYHSNKDSEDAASGNMIINYKGRSDITYSDGLYWKKLSGTVSGTTFSYAGSADANLHSRGLVKINGTIYLISSVSGTAVQISEAPGDGTVDAYFALCNVIDNGSEKNGTELNYDHGYGYGYYRSRSTDDGDLITETFSKQGTDWIFDASINSKNLPDGPVTLHMVAFDAAGNSSETPFTLDCTVSNNAPRLAGMLIGTDENGNGTVDESEFITNYHVADVSTYDFDSAQSEVVYPAQTSEKVKAALTVKGVTEIKPEIVGGNGKISYEYSVYKYNETERRWLEAEKCGTVRGSDIASGSTDEIAELDDTILLPVSAFIGTVDETDSELISDGKNKKFEFRFGDSTPGKNQSDAISNNAKLSVIMNVSLREKNSAENYILPLYWNSASDNSIFGADKKNGHIEYAKDWILSSGYNASEREFDADPKVSGKIKIEGIARDDTLLREIKVKFGTGMGSMGSTDTAIASYDAENSSTWILRSSLGSGNVIPDSGWASDVVHATYAELVSVGIIDELPSGKKAGDEVPYTSQEYGHVVHWILYVDTEKVSGTAALDVTVTASATDRGTPKWSSGESEAVYTANTVSVTGTGYSGAVTKTGSTVTEGPLTGLYRMDVVPYISEIVTKVRNSSGLKANNIRSASGKYSVLANVQANTITVNGFNFNPTAAWIVKESNLGAASFTTQNASRLSYVTGTSSSFTIRNQGITKSGYLEVYSNGIRTLNNINGNEAKGNLSSEKDYKNMPNREPDYIQTKNIILTDDRYFRFFDMKTTAIKNGYYPNMILDGDDPVFGYIDLNGVNSASSFNGYIQSCYQAQRTKFSGTDASFTDIEYLEGAITSDQMAMVRDEDGKYIHATVYNYSDATMDVIYNDYAEDHTWSGYTDGWAGGTGYSGYGGVYSYDGNNNAIALERTSFGNGTLIGRYQNIRMVAKGNSSTRAGASIYMAYYDDNTTNKDIIFRTFKIGTNNGWTNTLNTGNRGTRGRYSNLADRNTNGRITAGSSGSKYLDLGITSDNIAVIVYYDVNDARLKLRYSKEAVDGNTVRYAGGWNDAAVEFPEYVGTDVSMTIDSNDGIHIAAFDAGDSDLVYMYLPSCGSNSLKTVRVDQYGSVGNWTCIRVKDDVPYIAYYNSTEAGSREPIKLAYFAAEDIDISDADENELQGINAEGYTTGVWEYMTVPAVTPPQGSDSKFRAVNLDFDSKDRPVLGYLGTTLEFGKMLDE
ncbi:hypothetical protein DYE49_11250 [Treponema rectale]|uniref:Ig-like domain (Group 3) n=1 Tax=Treponema rectale TaxID=744512 RepID=A0A840SG23_9SPIR|nr:hypothetical protein [Treponema rectale]MBB5219108.1 hypothetical protein [Treponema rectale]QOS40990.1 hypothetical protein DYE49_11250 [Treponema rectale]